jgi:hypothetical protein
MRKISYAREGRRCDGMQMQMLMVIVVIKSVENKADEV